MAGGEGEPEWFRDERDEGDTGILGPGAREREATAPSCSARSIGPAPFCSSR